MSHRWLFVLALAASGCDAPAAPPTEAAPAQAPTPPAAEPTTPEPTTPAPPTPTPPTPIPPAPTPPTPTPEPPPPATPSPPPRTVLLIPGTTIKGSFFDDMATRLRADGFAPVIYEPPDLFTESLATGARAIAAVVDARLRATGEQRLHIVAECNGGVATRYYLQVLGGAAKVDQVVTFVSAHHGTWESPVGAWITGFQSLYDITPGSDFLATLDRAPFPAGLQLTSIYSCWDEFMVPYTTSVVEGATNVLFCDYKITHFDGFWDAVVYSRILTALEGKTAPTRY